MNEKVPKVNTNELRRNKELKKILEKYIMKRINGYVRQQYPLKYSIIVQELMIEYFYQLLESKNPKVIDESSFIFPFNTIEINEEQKDNDENIQNEMKEVMEELNNENNDIDDNSDDELHHSHLSSYSSYDSSYDSSVDSNSSSD